MSRAVSTDVATLPELLRTRAAEIGDERFVRDAHQEWTYAEFAARVAEVAAGLREREVGEGDVVGVVLPNSPHNNPPMNYFIGESGTGLAEMLPRWREDDVRVIIITGAIPDKYITHYSVEELVDLAEDREDLIRRSYDLINGWHSLLRSLGDLDKPVIAATPAAAGSSSRSTSTSGSCSAAITCSASPRPASASSPAPALSS